MGFASLSFFVFLAGLMLAYFLVPKRSRWMVLLAGSFLYIGLNSPHTLIALFASSAVAFVFARKIETEQTMYTVRLEENRQKWSDEEKKTNRKRTQKRKRVFLAAALVFLFGTLAVLKYVNFGIENFNLLLVLFGIEPIAQISWLMPLGISIYTLQISGYLIDVYRGKYAADRNFLQFLLFASWFPQLVQGPISRHGVLANQLYRGNDFDWNRAKSGALCMLWGLFKKMVIADRLAMIVNPIFTGFEAQGYAGMYIWIALVLYSFQIYADFSGGMDVVLGISEIFGIRMTENFRRPMLAGSVAEFWQRWHITLGSWMRDYLFYPLALSGPFNRLGKKLRKRFGPYVAKVAPASLASLIVFTCVGVWYGAEWKYFVYGVYQAVFVSTATLLEPFYARTRQRLHINADRTWFRMMCMLRTFIIIAFGRLLSRSTSLGAAMGMLKAGLGEWNPSVLWDGSLLQFSVDTAGWIVLGIAWVIWMLVDAANEREIVVRRRIEKLPLPLRWVFYITAAMVVLIFGIYGPGFDAMNFIYGQF